MKSIILHNHDAKTFKLSVFGYAFVGAASNGFYQERFWGGTIHPLFWILIALCGGIVLTAKNIYIYQKNGKLTLIRDLLFILPVVFIPLLLSRHDFALILMLSYGIVNLILYIYGYFKTKTK